MVTNVNQTCWDYFPIYTNIESLCCTTETNVIYQLYLNGKKKKKSLGGIGRQTVKQHAMEIQRRDRALGAVGGV